MRPRPLADQNVELEILHRRVEDFLHGGGQAVDFVYEQHIARLNVREQRGQIAGALHYRAAGGAELRLHLPGHNARQRGLAQPRRAVEEQMVEAFAPRPGGGDEDAEVLAQAVLAHHLGERAGPKLLLQAALCRQRVPAQRAPRLGLAAHRESLRRAARTSTSISASPPSSASTSSATRSARPF